MTGTSGRSRLRAASGIVAALVAGSLITWGSIAAFADDEPEQSESDGAGWDGGDSFSGPCGIRDIRAQQQARDLEPDDPSVREALYDAGIGVSLVDRGICVDLSGAATRPEWSVGRVRLVAERPGQQWSWTSGARERPVFEGALRVPDPGCARVRAVVDVRNRDGVTGTWSLEETYGWGCEKAPGRLYPPGTPTDRR